MERIVIQTIAEATQMAEISQEKAIKAAERERKFRASSVKAKEIAARALKQERKSKIALILSWLFFGSSEKVGMISLSLPGGL